MLPKLLNHLQSPAHKSWVNFDGHPHGDAMDLGWRKEYQNPNQPLFSLGELQVLGIAFFEDAGNNIAMGANYDEKHDIWVACGHLQHQAPVAIGDVLTRASKFGNMGNSGRSNGEHTHIRACLVPAGTPFSWDKMFTMPRINPYDYIFATPEMDVLGMKPMPNDWKNPVAPEPEKPSGTREFTIPSGSTLYDAGGKAYSIKTTSPKKVTIIRENNGMGLFRAGWLVGVTEAWVKLGGEPSKPTSDVGKVWTPLKTPLTLYPKSTGGTSYGPSNTKRNYKILAEADGRIQIQHLLFDAPEHKVWVDKSAGLLV